MLVVIGLEGLPHGALIGLDAENRARLRRWLDRQEVGAGVGTRPPLKRRDIEHYIRAAEQHGIDDDPDHEVGDLQDHLRDMWNLLTPEQRSAFAALSDVRARVELGTGSIDEDEDEGAPDQ